jgi:S-DNA-T family DNA segregation ATPase FtsK/SpoIIIE
VVRIAKLPNRERRNQLATVLKLAGDRVYPPPASFDPDAPARFDTHPACVTFVANPDQWPKPGPTIDAWLGEAVEIKPATTATFEQYIRSNLLVVGAEEHGHGLLLATVLSAAVQRSPADVSFVITEFARPVSPFHDFFAPLRNLPHDVEVAGPRGADAALKALTADLDQRLTGTGDSPQPQRFFLVAGLHRWQELLIEGEWGKPSETATQLIRLADKGPEVGIHVVAWADSYATAERALKRAGVAQFILRVALRLSSVSESDALLGVPAAASLADNRALFRVADWPHEQVEKFKPYSIASLQAFAQTTFRRPA